MLKYVTFQNIWWTNEIFQDILWTNEIVKTREIEAEVTADPSLGHTAVYYKCVWFTLKPLIIWLFRVSLIFCNWQTDRMANNTKLIIMSVLMVVTGSLNTVFVKLADMQTSENSVGDTEGSGVFFNHPFLQVEMISNWKILFSSIAGSFHVSRRDALYHHFHSS